MKPDPNIFEVVLADHWFSKTRKRSVYYANHRAKPLLDAGFVTIDREEKHTYDNPKENWSQVYYKPTEAGLRWWISERAKDYGEVDTSKLAEYFDGKGIGCEVAISNYCRGAKSVFAAMQDGFVEFSRKTDHPWSPGFQRHVVVKLTKKGMDYFDSLPKLVLECA